MVEPWTYNEVKTPFSSVGLFISVHLIYPPPPQSKNKLYLLNDVVRFLEKKNVKRMVRQSYNFGQDDCNI